ncbi:MAG: LD-carboxypeptidase [Spirochaetota bacterium]|nr:MAG: LD-carboxypeptidase [Spirochaetota bacterium]
MKEFNRGVIKPRCLREGDTIGAVAPAWTFDQEEFMEGMNKIEQLGYRVKYDNSIFKKYWSMAGIDKWRAQQITEMFKDREVKAILCANAGYGSIRTLPYLDKRIIRRNPKIFVGYSDITILLAYLRTIARMVVFHGPVITGEIYDGMNQDSLDYLLKAISSTSSIGILKPPSLQSLCPGIASGVLVGGNLSMLISSVGTPYEVDTGNKILFLEEINESLEVIDNHLMQLKLSGKIRHIKGLILGQLINCKDTSGNNFSIADVIDDVFAGMDIPIIYGFPSGHQAEDGLNITIPFGITVTLNADDPQLIIHGAGVSE